MAVLEFCTGLVLGSMNTAGYAAKKGTPKPKPAVVLVVDASTKVIAHEAVPADTYCAHRTRPSVSLFPAWSRAGSMWVAGGRSANGISRGAWDFLA